MSNWDNIVCEKELTSVKNKRKSDYDFSKERKVALSELEDEGWEYVSDYADPKFVKVRKEKAFDEKFENKIWMLMYQMGFTHMNKDRNFHMTHDKDGHTQQIDIFAADDETVLLIECKAAESQKDGNFKKEIEALQGQKEGLIKEARSKFPNCKVKFIWATENYIMQKADLKRLQDWDIVYFGESTISYYSDLVKHLGSCARYQLLGNLFANTEIKNMQNKIPAIEGKMGGFKYYEFSIEPEKLLKIGYVLHRSEANKNMMPTYQRIIKKSRLKSVRSFINDGGYFPNSLIISIDTKGKGLQFDQSQTKVEGALSKIGVLHLPKRYHSAYIIDGQHRLYGYSDSDYAETNTVPVVAFVDLDRKEQLKLFMDINENQKAVSKTLRVTLNGDMLWDSNKKSEQREALRSRLAQMCGEEPSSPLLGRIVIGEDEKTSTKCITIEALQSALKRSDFFTAFAKNNNIEKAGTFDTGDNQSTCDKFYPFMEDCLKYIRSECSDEWELGEDGILTINRGIQATIRVVNDIVNLCVEQSKFNPLKDNMDDFMEEVYYYLNPLIKYINNVTDEQRSELKSFLGGGADNKFWRTFQKAIADTCDDFNPDGLKEFIENETKQYNSDARDYIFAIESKVKLMVAEELEIAYGDNWRVKGVPKAIYKKAKADADERSYEALQNDEDIEVDVWDYVSLEDCRSIVLYTHNWSEIFESKITLPDEKKLPGGKEAKSEWLVKISKEKNKLLKSSYSIPKDMFERVSYIYNYLESE